MLGDNNLSEDEIISQLQIQTNNCLSREECIEYLKSCNWDLNTCLQFLVILPNEINQKTNIPFSLCLKILQNSNFNIEACQSHVNQLINFQNISKLNYFISFDCLCQANWNDQYALQLFQENLNNIPKEFFINDNNNTENNIYNEENGDLSPILESGCISTQHQNSPESPESPINGAQILQNTKISIITDYFGK
ncbi:hypothetical protein ABK040_002318 [Willaertia magna]